MQMEIVLMSARAVGKLLANVRSLIRSIVRTVRAWQGEYNIQYSSLLGRKSSIFLVAHF